MKDVTHYDDISLRQSVLEEISSLKPYPVRHPLVSNKFLEYWLDRGKVEADAAEVGASQSGVYHALSKPRSIKVM
jgi:hypothetical protein